MAKKEKEALEGQEELMDADHTELRVYELGFHIDPELSPEEAKKAYQAVRAAAEKAGGIVAEGEPRKVALAYTVSRSENAGRRDFDASYFSWIAYEANGEGHQAVTEVAKDDTRIFRFIDLRTTKDEARHASEMQELLAKTPEPKEAEEEVLDAELDAALKEVAA
jgi:ribosomal protein S6